MPKWHKRISDALSGEGSENDRQLRRFAEHEVVPRAQTTWRIGEACRDAGIVGSSGLLAIWNHQDYFLMALTILDDLARVDESKRSVGHRWLRYAQGSKRIATHGDGRWPVFDQLRRNIADATSELGDLSAFFESALADKSKPGPLRFIAESAGDDFLLNGAIETYLRSLDANEQRMVSASDPLPGAFMLAEVGLEDSGKRNSAGVALLRTKAR